MNPALPAAQPGETDLQRGWRLGIIAAWKATIRADPRTKAIRAIEALGNAGPPDDLGAQRSGMIAAWNAAVTEPTPADIARFVERIEKIVANGVRKRQAMGLGGVPPAPEIVRVLDWLRAMARPPIPQDATDPPA